MIVPRISSAVPSSEFRVPSFTILVCLILAWSAAPSFAEQSADVEARYLAGLRERRLFELAEGYCRRKLAQAYIVRRRRAELTIELSRTQLESALYAKPPRRDELFADAAKTLNEARFEGPDDPWRVPVGVQRGLIELVRGELLREEAQGLTASEPGLAAARERLRAAVAQLRKSRDEVDERLRAANRPGLGIAKPDEPTADEWLALKRHVDYQLARAFRNQGESYPPGSPDRAAALDQATQALTQLARSDAADDVTWEARLDEVVCRRLLGDLDGAERMLELIDAQVPPTDVAERARAQRIRIRLDAGLPDEARKFLRNEDVEPHATVSADVQTAALEWMWAASAAAAKAGRETEARDWQTRAAALTRVIVERHPARWARRAETLSAAAAATSSTGDARVLLKAAESFYQQGNADRALEVYDQAATAAGTAGDANTAYEAGFTAAAIERTRRRHDAAAERLLKLVATLPQHARAGEAHLAAIYETAEQLRTAADPQTLIARYTQLLEDHVRRWPHDATTGHAYYLLGLLRLQQRNWSAAATALSQTPPDAPFAEQAIAALEKCYAADFAARQAAGKPTPMAEVEQALKAFIGPTSRRAALARGRLSIAFADDRFDVAAGLLEPLVESATTDEERSSIAAWLTAADVGRGRYDAALERAQTLRQLSAEDAAAIVPRIDALAAQRGAADRTAAGAVLLRLLELRRDAATDDAPTIAEARALTVAGRTAEARTAWETLVRQSPNDVALQEAFAEFLLAQPDRNSAEKAAAAWRVVGRAAPESSPQWYRARLGLARAYVQMGDKPRATQLLDLTRALHPELGGAEMKGRFEALERVIGGAR